MSSRKNTGVILWVIAVLLTMAAAAYQRRVGPTRPVRGQLTFASQTLRYKLLRSTPAPAEEKVSIGPLGAGAMGTLVFRRYPTDDPWTTQPMRREGDRLVGLLPHQPWGGKVEYQVFLSRPAADAETGIAPSTTYATLSEAIPPASTALPPDGPVAIRFRGDVPAWVMIPHILLMFLAMLWSNRAGLEALRSTGRVRRLAGWTLVFLFVGGMLIGPLVQKYSFGAFWTGFPFGYDLTDNKTLIAVLTWALALAVGWRSSRGLSAQVAPGTADPWSGRTVRVLVLIAAIVTLVIFSIPHSVLGTELKHPPAGSGGERPLSYRVLPPGEARSRSLTPGDRIPENSGEFDCVAIISLVV